MPVNCTEKYGGARNYYNIQTGTCQPTLDNCATDEVYNLASNTCQKVGPGTPSTPGPAINPSPGPNTPVSPPPITGSPPSGTGPSYTPLSPPTQVRTFPI